MYINPSSVGGGGGGDSGGGGKFLISIFKFLNFAPKTSGSPLEDLVEDV